MQESPSRRSNADRTEATRAHLLHAARRLFERHGYAATGTPEIVAEARVTRGALYHHFVDKADLFLAVARQAAAEVAADVARRGGGRGSPADALAAGADAYFAAMAEPGRARLLLREAPAVLSPEQLRQLSDATGVAELREGLRALLDEGAGRGTKPARQVPIDALADLLSAAFDRAALAIADGQPAARYRKAIRMLLDGLA